MTSTYIRLRLPTFGNREMSETGREATALVHQHVSHHNDFDKIYLKPTCPTTDTWVSSLKI